MNEKMSANTNALNWFEISVKDISRAKIYYEKIFEIKMSEMEMMGMKYAMFPFDPTKATVSDGLAQSQMHTPSATGAIIYLNANPDLQNVLNRIEKAGGKTSMQKTAIGENGFIGLHSNK
jgi:uncharacterized protein